MPRTVELPDSEKVMERLLEVCDHSSLRSFYEKMSRHAGERVTPGELLLLLANELQDSGFDRVGSLLLAGALPHFAAVLDDPLKPGKFSEVYPKFLPDILKAFPLTEEMEMAGVDECGDLIASAPTGWGGY